MKLLLILLSSIALLVGCGKKAELKDPSEKGILPTDAEIYFNALKEVKSAVLTNNLLLLKETLSKNPYIDMNQLLDDGDTFLITSIKKDFRDIRNFLILVGVQLEKTNVNKETPLIVAVNHNQRNSVQILLEKKVDLEKVDIHGNTALHNAIKKSLDDIALFLIKQGANVETKDRDGASALKLASDYNVPKTQEFIKSIQLLEVGAPDIASYRKILTSADHVKLKETLNKYPRIAYDQVYESVNPLAILIDAEDEADALRTAKLLLDYQSNVNGPRGSPETPLIKATSKRKKNFVSFLLIKNANPSLLDKEGKSALIYAVELNDFDIVSLLLNYAASEKYSFRREGEKITFDACSVAKETAKALSTQEEKATNLKIRKALNCRFLGFSL